MLDAFLQYLEQQVLNHSIYVWGAQGKPGTEITETWIRSRETSRNNADRAIEYWKKQVAAGYGQTLRAFDCSGLAVFFLLENGLLKKDTTAEGLRRLCGKITSQQLYPGDFVFKVGNDQKAYHVGYVADESRNVIEAKGRSYGVVKSPLKGWDAYGRPPFFRAEDGIPKGRVLFLTTPYLRGADVLSLQQELVKRGYNPGLLDGIYGPVTTKAVRAAQAALGLTVDGEAGPLTFAALNLPYGA